MMWGIMISSVKRALAASFCTRKFKMMISDLVYFWPKEAGVSKKSKSITKTSSQ